jgi:hypothetical protein
MELAAKTMNWDDLAHSVMILETAVMFMLDKVEIETYHKIINILENEKVLRLKGTNGNPSNYQIF